MQMQNEEPTEAETVPGWLEESMKRMTSQSPANAEALKTCTHSRLIDNVVTKAGKWTGKVKCRECGARFDDPYRGLK